MPESVMIKDLYACGYNFRDLRVAFPGESTASIEQRYRDTALGLRRTVERFGYLATRPCRSEFFNVGADRTRQVSVAVPQLKPESCVTVGLFGGSIAMGAGLGDAETIPSRLQAYLDRARPGNFRVWNYSSMNHTSQHATLRLLDLSQSGNSPDVAIFLDGWNDCFHAGGSGDGLVAFLDEAVRLAQSDSDTCDPQVKLRSILEASSSAPLRHGPRDSVTVESERAFLKRRLGLSYELRRAVAQVTRSQIQNYWEPSVYHDCRPEQDPVPDLARANKREFYVKEHMSWVRAGGLDRLFARHGVMSLSAMGKSELPGVLYLDRVHPSPLLADFMATYIAHSLTAWMRKVRMRTWLRGRRNLTTAQMPTPEGNPDLDIYPMW